MQIKYNKNNIFTHADYHYNINESVFKRKNNCQKITMCSYKVNN